MILWKKIIIQFLITCFSIQRPCKPYRKKEKSKFIDFWGVISNYLGGFYLQIYLQNKIVLGNILRWFGKYNNNK